MQTHSSTDELTLSEYLDQARNDIYAHWFERTSHAFGSHAARKINLLHANRQAGKDLFGVLLDSMKRQIKPSGSALGAIFRKIRTPDYSIHDYFTEACCLEESLDYFLRSAHRLTDRQLLDGTTLVRRTLNEITAQLLDKCTQIFEHVTETGKTAFCQTDTLGNIVYANRAMERLAGESPLIGRKLSDYFKDEDLKIVRNAILNREETAAGIQKLTIISAEGKRTIVGAQIGPVLIDGQHKGGFAQITDISLVEGQHYQLYNRAMMGITNIDRQGDIVFANKSMLQMLNMDDYRGVSVFDILPDDEQRQFVRKQLDSRFGWESNEYPLELLRKGDNTKIPVMVSAFPQTDLNGTRVIGSFAIVRSLVARRMHYQIESNHDEAKLLEAVMKELSLVIPFEMAAVSKYSKDRKFACSIFTSKDNGEKDWQRRWWKLTPAQIKWAEQEDDLIVEDFEEFLKQPDWKIFKKEKDIKSLLADGYRSFLFFPIRQDNHLVASVSLWRKSSSTFKPHHLKILRNLPIKSAVYVALHYHSRKESAMVTDLIMNLTGAGRDIQSIAEVIVDSVSKYFNRQSVCLFKVNKKSSTIKFIAQANTKPKYMVEKDYEQKIGNGVLGHVIKYKTVENIGHIQKDKRFKNIYVSPLKGVTMRSELCIPIAFGGALWLLNIEDEQVDAFSEEEENELIRVMKEVRNYLEKTWLSRFLEASLESSSDAVLVTNTDACIIQVNPTAEAILAIPNLKHTPDRSADRQKSSALRQIPPTDLREIFIVPEEADNIIKHGCAPISPVKLKRRLGGSVTVVLTVVDLQEDFGNTIYLATDLTAQQKMKEIENLAKIYYELAIQTKTPLSLALGWIERLETQLDDVSSKNMIEKTQRQLKKLELTYNRLAMYADGSVSLPFNRTLLDLSEVISAVKSTLPESEQAQIDWPKTDREIFIQGDLFQLRFCFETILSYLLRFIPQDDIVTFETVTGDGSISMTIKGWLPGQTQLSTAEISDKLQEAQTVADLAFGQKLIHEILVTRHGGTFTMSRKKNDIAIFKIGLRQCEGGRYDT